MRKGTVPTVPSAFLPSGNGGDGRDCQYDEAQHDAVHAKELEVVPLDVVHQEADGPHAHRKGLKMHDWMRGYLTYVLPVIVLFIFAFGIYDKFFA